MNSAGLLTVRGVWSAGELKALAVDLQRPTLTRLFIGQPPAQVAKTLPHLYSLCAEAQGAVARVALQAAGAELTLAANDQRLWSGQNYPDRSCRCRHSWRLTCL